MNSTLARKRYKTSRDTGNNFLARFVRILTQCGVGGDIYFPAEANNVRLLDLRNAPTADAEREELKKHLLDITRKRATLAKQYTVSLLAVTTNTLTHSVCSRCY
jgi:hypothetical protein